MVFSRLLFSQKNSATLARLSMIKEHFNILEIKSFVFSSLKFFEKQIFVLALF